MLAQPEPLDHIPPAPPDLDVFRWELGSLTVSYVTTPAGPGKCPEIKHVHTFLVKFLNTLSKWDEPRLLITRSYIK